MELVAGESLADRLARGPLPPAEALRTAIAILDALAVLHGHGIVHRDLKPSNVFLGPAGVKLLDFGLARPLHAAGDVTGQPLTAAGMFVGTPQYASPEQLTGADGRRAVRFVLGGGGRLRDADRPAALQLAPRCRRWPTP